MEDFTVRRRNRLRHHYTLTSNVLLFGYKHLPDSAKLTYQVIDSFDWQDGAGLRKGYAYPSLRTLAEIRGVDERTIRRHIAQLEQVGLLSRKERPGRPSLLVIEDPSAVETQRYLQTFGGGGEDKNVRPTPDRNVRSLLEEDKEQERRTTLTTMSQLSGVGGKMRPGRVGDAVRERVASLVHKKQRSETSDKARRDWLAEEILKVCRDERSLGLYRRIASTIPQDRVFEALSQVRMAIREGRVRKSKGALFVRIVSRPTDGGNS